MNNLHDCLIKLGFKEIDKSERPRYYKDAKEIIEYNDFNQWRYYYK